MFCNYIYVYIHVLLSNSKIKSKIQSILTKHKKLFFFTTISTTVLTKHKTAFFSTTISTTILTKQKKLLFLKPQLQPQFLPNTNFFLNQPHKKYFLLNYFFQTITTKLPQYQTRDIKILFGVFIVWCLRPETFFPKINDDLKLLKMSYK